MTTTKARTLRLLTQVNVLESHDPVEDNWVDLVLTHTDHDCTGYEVTQTSIESMLWNPEPDKKPDSDSDVDTLVFYLHERAWRDYNDRFYDKSPERVFVVTLIAAALNNDLVETERVYIWDDDDDDEDWYDYWD